MGARKQFLASPLDQVGGSLVHSCLPPSSGGSPRNLLLSKGRLAEPEPWQGAASGGLLCPLQTDPSQLHLRAPVPAMEAPGAQASLSKDWPQTPRLPTFVGCLGPPLGLQQRKARIPKLPVHAASLTEGRGERVFLRFLHLEAWREGSAQACALGGPPRTDLAHRPSTLCHRPALHHSLGSPPFSQLLQPPGRAAILGLECCSPQVSTPPTLTSQSLL